MSKLYLSNRVKQDYDKTTLTQLFLSIQNQLNALSEGRVSARYQSSSTIPTTSSYPNAVAGDIVWNLGVSSGGYVGWVYLTSGSWTTFGAVS